jgi:hypothetical protein
LGRFDGTRGSLPVEDLRSAALEELD